MSGYTDCACRDCFDVAVSSDIEACRPGLCGDCEDAGCDPHGSEDCYRTRDADDVPELNFDEDAA